MNSYYSVLIWIHTSTPSYEFKSCVWIHIFKSIPTTPAITHTESSIGRSPSVLVHYDNLPYGCGNKFYPRGRALCIDHNTKCTALERPLPPIEDHCKHNDPSELAAMVFQMPCTWYCGQCIMPFHEDKTYFHNRREDCRNALSQKENDQ